MLSIVRRFLGSKLGGLFALGFLGIIAFAFAAGDVTRHDMSFLSGGSSDVATVGSTRISAASLQDRIQRVFQQNRRENPAITMDSLIAQNGIRQVLDQMTAGIALQEFSQRNGMRPGKKLVDAEIARMGAFADAAGNFSQDKFQELLARERIPEQALRDDILKSIIQRQLLMPAGAAVQPPMSMIQNYAAMLLEQRTGRIADVPSAAFAPQAKPADADIQRFYAQNGARFAIPEQRSVRYAVVDISRFEGKNQPSEAEIAQYYKANAAKYAATQTRTVRQLVFLNEAAARATAAKLGSGSLEAAAKAAGLETTVIGPLDRNGIKAATSDAAAQAIFAAAKGGVTAPVKTGLGWALFRVESVQDTPARALDAVRAEIVPLLAQDKSRQMLSDMVNKLDGAIGDGSTFDELVKANGLTAAETSLLTADGKRIGAAPAETPDAALPSLAKAGFSMEQDDDPQLVPLDAEKRFAIVALKQVVPSGPPPLASVRPAVEQAWALAQGVDKARKAAMALKAGVEKGQTLEQALAGAGVRLPPIASIGARRADLGQKGKPVPKHLAALFSMRKGSARIITLSNNLGYAVVVVDTITPGNPAGNQQLLSSTAQGLSGVMSNEMAEQFQRAIEREVGVSRNAAAIASVTAELRKANGAGQ